MKYDSTSDTLKHIKRVNELLIQSAKMILDRAIKHDSTKLVSPEKEAFDILTPRLNKLKFGSPEYEQSKNELKDALDHHYARNSHHPQHYKNGINDMDLFDVIEMFIDWKASSERQNDGNILKSIEFNKQHFGISEQLTKIFENTAITLDEM